MSTNKEGANYKKGDTFTDTHEQLGGFGVGAAKAGIIESNYVVPTKVMTVQPGVELIEKGKITAGEKVKYPNKMPLSDYNKMKDPRF